MNDGLTIFQRLFDVPLRDGRIVAMCNFRDRLVIATELTIYEAHIDDVYGLKLRAVSVETPP